MSKLLLFFVTYLLELTDDLNKENMYIVLPLGTTVVVSI